MFNTNSAPSAKHNLAQHFYFDPTGFIGQYIHHNHPPTPSMSTFKCSEKHIICHKHQTPSVQICTRFQLSPPCNTIHIMDAGREWNLHWKAWTSIILHANQRFDVCAKSRHTKHGQILMISVWVADNSWVIWAGTYWGLRRRWPINAITGRPSTPAHPFFSHIPYIVTLE